MPRGSVRGDLAAARASGQPPTKARVARSDFTPPGGVRGRCKEGTQPESSGLRRASSCAAIAPNADFPSYPSLETHGFPQGQAPSVPHESAPQGRARPGPRDLSVASAGGLFDRSGCRGALDRLAAFFRKVAISPVGTMAIARDTGFTAPTSSGAHPRVEGTQSTVDTSSHDDVRTSQVRVRTRGTSPSSRCRTCIGSRAAANSSRRTRSCAPSRGHRRESRLTPFATSRPGSRGRP